MVHSDWLYDDWVPGTEIEYARNGTHWKVPGKVLYDQMDWCMAASCNNFDLGDVSSVFLDGLISARHNGKQQCFPFMQKNSLYATIYK